MSLSNCEMSIWQHAGVSRWKLLPANMTFPEQVAFSKTKGSTRVFMFFNFYFIGLGLKKNARLNERFNYGTSYILLSPIILV